MPEAPGDDIKGKVLHVRDLVSYQDGTIASRMIVFKKAGTITVFSFDEGEGLPEHTAPYDAVLTVIDGEAEVSAEGTPFTIREGGMIILPANKPHAVYAKKRFKMILTMIRE
jgi:quercetin dioxygenase-like cupin family protein